MAFCFKFKRDRQYMDVIDEIIIKYHLSNNLLDFLKEHKDQRIILDIEDAHEFLDQNGVTFLTFVKNSSENPGNWAVRFPSIFSEKTININKLKTFQELEIPYFFNTYIDRWDILYGLFELGVSDIYITNELGFELDKVKAAADKYNCKIRVLPNVAQSAWFDTPDLKKFFIRPEDIDDYAPYVDVFEFFENDDSAPSVGSVLYNIYANDKQWYGRLKEIISNFNSELDGRFTHPLWISRRIKCGKKCLKGSRCDMCNTIAALGETLEKVGVTVGKEKPEKELPSREEMDALIEKYYNTTTKKNFLLEDEKTTATVDKAEEEVLDAIEQAIKNDKN